jgi:hypothetical protein
MALGIILEGKKRFTVLQFITEKKPPGWLKGKQNWWVQPALEKLSSEASFPPWECSGILYIFNWVKQFYFRAFETLFLMYMFHITVFSVPAEVFAFTL